MEFHSLVTVTLRPLHSPQHVVKLRSRRKEWVTQAFANVQVPYSSYVRLDRTMLEALRSYKFAHDATNLHMTPSEAGTPRSPALLQESKYLF